MSFLQLHSTKKQSTQLNYTPGARNFGLSGSNQKEVHGLGRGGLKGSMHRQVTIDSECLQSVCGGGGGGGGCLGSGGNLEDAIMSLKEKKSAFSVINFDQQICEIHVTYLKIKIMVKFSAS